MDRNQDRNQRPDNAGEQNKDLPGYPHYPPEEDIMNPQSGFKKIHADEELANSTRLSSRVVEDKRNAGDAVEDTDDDDLGIVKGTEADVTAEDMVLLGERNADQDVGDDELTRSARIDELEEDEDLDVPGAELDDEEESIGEEDEENNYYSLGGDRHENLEEDPPNAND
jgi:hypothetical protein